jgi:hypothetical protein
MGPAIQGFGLAQMPGSVADAAIVAGSLRGLLHSHEAKAPRLFLDHTGRPQVLPKLRPFIDDVGGRTR